MASIAKIETLNNSASKKGVTPSCIIGLSHPIKLPNQNTPKIYITDTEIINFKKV